MENLYEHPPICRVDENQAKIVAKLREASYSVLDIHAIGKVRQIR